MKIIGMLLGINFPVWKGRAIRDCYFLLLLKEVTMVHIKVIVLGYTATKCTLLQGLRLQYVHIPSRVTAPICILATVTDILYIL